MKNLSATEELNRVHYVYLRELSEPRDNSLRIVVEEAVVNKAGSVDLKLDALLKDASPIEFVNGCRLFELRWARYAAYLVTEELVGSNAADGYEDERFTGTLLRVYSKSHFLTHIARDTGGHTEPVQHYKVVCLNHIIDVAAYEAPDVRLSAADAAAPTQSSR
jgi:hypothetical protein